MTRMADRPAGAVPTWWPGLLGRVEALVGGRPVLVGVDGRSGVGKTDLALAAAELLVAAGHPAHVVHLDALYPGWSGLAPALPRLCAEVVAPLLAGRPGRYRSWDWDADRPGPPVVVPLRPVVVVEGVGTLASPCASDFDVRLWLEAPAAVRRVRALARDGETFAPHWDHWAEQEEAVLAARPPWDALVDTVTGRTRWSVPGREGTADRSGGATEETGTTSPGWDRLDP